MRRCLGWLAIALVPVGWMLGAGLLAQTPANAAIDATVGRFLAGSAPPLTSYRAVRRLNAATRGGRMKAALVVRTLFDQPGGLRYEIVEATGSTLIQKRVLVAALEAERQMHAAGTTARGALTGENYRFLEPAQRDPELVRVDLKARRQDTLLLDGAMFLTPEAFDLVRVEGELVKRPSFWTRKVNIVRRYGRIAGVRVPLAMESTAQVLFVGTSTFAMTYEYDMVNGTTVEAGPEDRKAGAPAAGGMVRK